MEKAGKGVLSNLDFGHLGRNGATIRDRVVCLCVDEQPLPPPAAHPSRQLIQGHAVVRQLGVRTNSQIGEIFGLTGSAVNRRVGVLKSKAVNDKSIRKKLQP